ncbi:MAG: response regulator transcription factor [Patescibacteria group bacterium]
MRILVIEDERKIAASLKRGLEQEAYAVDVCWDGMSGKATAITGVYDVIILDRMLPGIADGADIVTALRIEGLSTPVLMLTARDAILDRIEGLDAGADDYLAKPFAFEELLARVRALLRRPSESATTKLQVDSLVLDPSDKRVSRANIEIKLSVREYALLEYLLRNAGRIVTKDMIIEHVWDFDADILPNTVEVYIGYLRRKIDQPFPTTRLIHTVRGFGYRLGV